MIKLLEQIAIQRTEETMIAVKFERSLRLACSEAGGKETGHRRTS